MEKEEKAEVNNQLTKLLIKNIKLAYNLYVQILLLGKDLFFKFL